MIETLERLIAEHPFFSGLEERQLRLLTGCATDVRFDAGTYIFHESEEANYFYLIRQGEVALEISAPPRKPIVVEILKPGEILGWSWLVPPHRWRFHARAMEFVRALALDGKCLRTRCEEDHDLGYELLRRFTQVITKRLEAARFQLLDMYAPYTPHK